MNRPWGLYRGERGGRYYNSQGAGFFRATGAYRAPMAGEWYLSGAIVGAYLALNDLDSPYWIAERVAEPPREIRAHGVTYRRDS